MANRYWVGGTASWDGTAGSKWSLTSGGAGGEAVPTSSDDVFFDAASGAVTVTVAAGNTGCKSLNFSGFTGTFAGSTAITVSGGITMGAGMTWTHSGLMTVSPPSGSVLVTSNGVSTSSTFAFGASAGAEIVLFGDFVTTSGVSHTTGTLRAFNNVTMSTFVSASGSSRTLTMGTGTWTVTANAGDFLTIFQVSSTNLTLNANTSTIKITNTGTFIGGGMTFNNFWITGTNTSGVIITGANTFAEFKDDRSVAHTITFPNSTTTITSWNVNGTSGNVITLRRTGASGTWTISDASGTNTSSYLSISNSTATGGATWDVSDGTNTDGGGNTGWSFTPPPPPAQTVQQAARDSNFVTTLLVTNKIDGQAPMRAWVDPSTHSLVVSDASTGTDYSDDIASRDNNYVPVLMGVSSVDGVTPVAVYGDASTGAVLIDSN